MAALLEDKQVQSEQTDDVGTEIVLVLDRTTDLQELAQRCRELLAQRRATADYPPGHWLG